MRTKNCPECGENIGKTETVCSSCGYPIPQKKTSKKATITIIGLISVIAITVACIFTIPILQSQNAFEKAVTFEEALDYEGALYWYSQVNENDSENYSIASQKSEEIQLYIKTSKNIAMAYIALEDENLASSFDDMINIKVDAQDRQFVCKINGIGYYVNTIDMEKSEYYNVRYNKKTNLYITEYKASFQYNGYLTSTTNMLRQQTSDTMFQMSELVIKEGKVKLDLAQNYVNLYKETMDLSVLTSE